MGYFDRDKIEKITYNLLNNAFKYTPDGREIECRLQQITDEQLGRCAQIVVSDTGIGISAQEIENIFRQYYRVENATTQTVSGAGIGLSLVKKLVELHRGTLQVESTEGQGTTFTVTLPLERLQYKPSEIVEQVMQGPDSALNLAPDLPAAPTQLPKMHSGREKRRVLLAEDNEQLLYFMREALSDEFEVEEARNGTEAIEKLKTGKVDLVVSDVMMPYTDGFQLCRHIKTNPATQHLPVILLTAKTANEDQHLGLEHGADEYLTKPVNMELLKLRINNLLQTADAVRQKYENTLIADIDKLEVSDSHKEFVRSVVQLLEQNITNPDLNIDFFANKLGVSRTLLYEKIKKATGESLGTFIRTSRLNYSAKLLLENNYNTSELAYEVGFSDPKYFSKCFRKQFGQTPKDFLRERVERGQNA